METVNISISEKDLAYAQTVCAHITDANKRERAMTSVIGAQIASEFFDSQEYKIDTESGIHNLGAIIEFFDISDLYINNAYIDVRVYFAGDELKVPEVHFKTGILPAAYMFIKLDDNLQQGEVVGFVLPKYLDVSGSSNGMITVPSSKLRSFNEIKTIFSKAEEYTEDLSEEIYEFLEGSLEPIAIVNLFRHIVNSQIGRQKLLKAARAQSVFNIVSDLGDLSQAENVMNTENAADDENLPKEDLEGLINALDSEDAEQNSEETFEYTTEITPSGAELIESLDEQENEQTSEDADNNDETVEEKDSEDIETLFANESSSVNLGKKKQNPFFITALVVLLIIAGGGYYWWYMNVNNNPEDLANNIQAEPPVVEQINSSHPEQEAMPVETVENNKIKNDKEAGNSATVTAIEKNLDSSILVTNLKIDWEVPAGYASNTAAKRYLIKLGKIIQLNLKTELLLLSKPPLANKITVELTYNNTTERFDVIGIRDSSGEKTVDDAILNAIKSALNYKISSNTTSFAKLQGNPVIVIHL